MKKHALALSLAILTLLSLRPSVTDRLRSIAVGAVAPPIKVMRQLAKSSAFSSPESEELHRLSLENERLKAQIAFLSRFDRYQEMVSDQLEELGECIRYSDSQRRAEVLAQMVEHELRALPARVTLRTANSWSDCCWIGVGQRDNHRLGEVVIGKNSPVVVGTSLVGIVDHVGHSRSRVRLIGDSSLHPAVRVVRGGPQDRELLAHVSAVQEGILARGDLFSTDQATKTLLENLEILKRHLDPEAAGTFLAKGSLHGSVRPQFRRVGTLLKGEGFNYDYSDEEGPSRDLRTGGVSGSDASPIPIVLAGDLLVTSGLDGLIPEGLSVATVLEVEKLQEGDCSYTLFAAPTAGDLNHLTQVFVLPPLDQS